MNSHFDTQTVLEILVARLIGTPYRFGGDDVTGIDCSGLVIELLQSVGVLPPGFDATAEGLRHQFPKIPNGTPATFGDLVFFGGAGTATHIGFCISSTLMLEAGGGTAQTKTLEDAQRMNAFVRIRPIANRRDLLSYGRPVYPA